MFARLNALAARRPYGAALLLGALSALAFPPAGIWPLFFLALPLLAQLLAAAPSPRAAFWRTLTFFGTQKIFTLYWIGASLLIKPEQHAWLIPFACILLPLSFALIPALAGALWRAWRRDDAAAPFLLAGLLTLAELAQAHLFTGFPWNLTASIWQHAPAMLQGLSLFGAFGLGALTLTLALLPHRRNPAALGLGWTLALLLALWGHQRLSAPPRPDTHITLRLVQPGIPQAEKWDAEKRQRHLNHLLALSQSQEKVDAVIWPETATSFFLNIDPVARTQIGFALPPDSLLLTGAVSKNFGDAGQVSYSNSLLALDGRGNIRARYDKAHLVPFGEYIPLRKELETFIPLRTIAGSGADFSAGPGPQTLGVAALPAFSPLICYEAIFPHAATRSGTRPHWLLNITNDGWFGRTAGPHQHLMAARMRAIEQGLPLVRVANTGISSVIDWQGRVRHRIPLGAEGAVNIRLPAAPEGQTLFRLAGGPVLLLILLGLLYPAFVLRKGRGTAILRGDEYKGILP